MWSNINVIQYSGILPLPVVELNVTVLIRNDLTFLLMFRYIIPYIVSVISGAVVYVFRAPWTSEHYGTRGRSPRVFTKLSVGKSVNQ